MRLLVVDGTTKAGDEVEARLVRRKNSRGDWVYSQRRDPNRMSEEVTRRFLAELEKCGILSVACAAVEIPKWWVNDRLRGDKKFREACDAAVEVATDGLEMEARRRATVGVDRVVVSGGRVVIDPTTQQPLVHREASDFLLLHMLKANRAAKYGNKSSVAVTMTLEQLVMDSYKPAAGARQIEGAVVEAEGDE
jgi:hypothetical protein